MTAAGPAIAPPDGVWASALAAELAAVPGRVRTAIGLPDMAIQALESAVRMFRTMLDDNDPRDLVKRLDDLSPLLEGLVGDGSRLAALTQWSEQDVKDKLERQLKRLKSPAGQAFLRRAVGSARYHRIKQALVEDGALLMLAARRVLRYVLPLAQAYLDAAAPLPAKMRGQYVSAVGTDRALLQAAIELDSLIEGFMEQQGIHIDVLAIPVRPDESTGLVGNVDQLIEGIRAALRAETHEKVTEVSDLLGRKLRGFEQALSVSDDGVSQAANSLVEFIDRLLRQAFDDSHVLAWACKHFPGDERMTHTDKSDVCRPTKFAQALCFVHAGEPPTDATPLLVLLAESLVCVRRAAEKLKHADVDDPDEVSTLRDLMAAVHGVMTVTMRFTWGLAGDDRLEYLRERFTRAS